MYRLQPSDCYQIMYICSLSPLIIFPFMQGSNLFSVCWPIEWMAIFAYANIPFLKKHVTAISCHSWKVPQIIGLNGRVEKQINRLGEGCMVWYSSCSYLRSDSRLNPPLSSLVICVSRPHVGDTWGRREEGGGGEKGKFLCEQKSVYIPLEIGCNILSPVRAETSPNLCYILKSFV